MIKVFIVFKIKSNLPITGVDAIMFSRGMIRAYLTRYVHQYST